MEADFASNSGSRRERSFRQQRVSIEATPGQEAFSVEVVHMDGNAVLRLHGELKLWG